MTNIKSNSFKTHWILMLIIVLSVLSFAAIQSQTNTEAEQHYDKANEHYKLDDYDAAITEFEQVIKLAPKSAIAQNAKYWIGQIYFEIRKFDSALTTFQELINEFPDSMVVSTSKTMIERVQRAQKNRSLFEAVKNGNIEQVKSLIAEGADIEGKWGDVYNKKEGAPLLLNRYGLIDSTPLWHAVDLNNIEMVKLLVEEDPNMNAGGWPPLCMAVDRNNTDIAEYLIDHGANVNYPQDWGPFHEACVLNIDMAKLLLDRGADINSGYCPPLHSAAMKGPKEVVELLVQRGADINAKDKWGNTPLYWVIYNIANEGRSIDNNIEIMNLLIDNGADVKNNNNILLFAVKTGCIEAVQSLLEAGADINAKNDSGQTTLHIAARNGYKDVAELLIDEGADINAKDNDGHTPLYIAVNNNYKVAELLINKGADSSIKTESGQTLLQLTEQRKRMESTSPDMIFVGEPNSLFGGPIACGDIDGDGYDDIIVGACIYNNRQGRVYLFYGGPDMDTTPDLIFEGEQEGDIFGRGIVCGDVDNDGYEDILVVADYYNERQGRAYLYWGSDRNSMDTKPGKIFTGEKGSFFGAGHPDIYDIDNDGYDDVIIGAIGSNARTGWVYLYYGNTKELMDPAADLIFKGENQGGRFGRYIRSGDVDNDGYGDICIGSNTGDKVYLYYGSSKLNMDAKADGIFEIKSEGNNSFGQSIVFVDQNRDGYDDVLIGAPGGNDGRAYLFHGNSKSSIDANPDAIFNCETRNSDFGSQGTCGDIDGDNVNDIIISALGLSQSLGRVYVYWSSELSSSDPKPGRILTGEGLNNTLTGVGLACGDVNNDGYDDIVIGASPYRDRLTPGRAYLYYGGPKE